VLNAASANSAMLSALLSSLLSCPVINCNKDNGSDVVESTKSESESESLEKDSSPSSSP